MEKCRFGVVGLGGRGMGILKGILLEMPDVEIVAVCDEYGDRTEAAAEKVREKCGVKPYMTNDHHELLAHGGMDAVFIATAWETHVEVAIDAMQAGIPVAMEVGGAYTLESLWNLVRTQERTGVPFMMMENCCFGKTELLVTSMVRRGILGKIVHCHGAYGHYLAEEIAGGEQNRHYRLRNYLNRNGENYPTHELGPIAKILDINRGNRMLSLVSVASGAFGMEDYIARNAEKYPELAGKKFRQGDIVNTIITCADGSTISLKLDTTLPRSYSREFTVHGTHGLYEMNTDSVYLAGEEESFDTAEYYRAHFGNVARFEADCLPEIWCSDRKDLVRAGHGGMDGIEFRVFVDCLREGRPMPIDVYDAAAWMAVTVLSEQSVAAGGAPQFFPDFTGGEWLRRERMDVVKL